MGVRAINRLPNGKYQTNYYYWDQHGMKQRGRKNLRTIRQAEIFYADRLKEYEMKVRVGSKERSVITVSQFLAEHYYPWASKAKRSWPGEHRFLKIVEKRWGSRQLCTIFPLEIEKWRLEFKDKITPATIIRYFSYLRAVFKFAHLGMKDDLGQTIGGGFIGENPMIHVKNPKVKPPTKPPTILYPEEIARIKSDGTRGTDLLLFAMHSGMRRGEIFRLKFEDIDRQAGVVRIPLSKNDESRIIPLTQTLSEIIERQPMNDTGFVFPWKGKQSTDCRTAFFNALKRAGITRKIRFHDLRHTFGSYLAMNGVDLEERMALMGHKTITAARIYTHYYTKKLSESMDRLTKAYKECELKTKGHEKVTAAVAV